MPRTIRGPMRPCHGQRQPSPRRNHRGEFGILRAAVRQAAACAQPVFPVERLRFGPPLLLEVERPFVRRRAAEIEPRETAARWRTSAFPSTAARWDTVDCRRAAPTPTALRSAAPCQITNEAATGVEPSDTHKSRVRSGNVARMSAKKRFECTGDPRSRMLWASTS